MEESSQRTPEQSPRDPNLPEAAITQNVSTSAAPMNPQRGAVILVLGILSLVIPCIGAILGIMAWVMGSGDLREMREGLRDPAGTDLTRAGMICGIVGTALQALALIIYAAYFAFIMAAIGSGW